MKYFTKEILSKILVAVLTTALMAVLGLCYNWWKGLDAMPGKMEQMEAREKGQRIRDSIALVKMVDHEKRKQDSIFKIQLAKIQHDHDSVIKVHKTWLDEDYLAIQEIKKRLKIK